MPYENSVFSSEELRHDLIRLCTAKIETYNFKFKSYERELWKWKQ
jgi:hypothetical protein